MEVKMDNNRNVSNCIASLALFKELYAKEKDVFDVIRSLIKYTINDKGLYSFNITKLTHEINELFGFDIPEAIVQTALKRQVWIQKMEHEYVILDRADLGDIKGIGSELNKINTNKQILDNELIEYCNNHNMIKNVSRQHKPDKKGLLLRCKFV